MTGTSIKSILAFALLVGVASQANADIWDHIDQQAVDIERTAKRLRGEVDHYRHTRYYGQLIGATARLKGQAIHVHNIAHHSHNAIALKHAVKELDRAFHDTEELFDRVEHNAAYGDGHIRGNTSHVKQMLNGVESCIHHLQDDVRRLARIQTTRTHQTYRPAPHVYSHREVYNRPVQTRPVYSGGYGYDHGRHDRGHRVGHDRGHSRHRNDGGVAFSIGGGSSRITFRF
ncbi:hypothetical protein [Mariniblastus fucicola]|uniref:Uncharacterized protein n=1 Tax=Mariniblastus fucicola TaxID=980251 RepID=A0A5B9PRS1_9BACT|nr:hypothetical protein [Mariniblastus fucicola]QEG25211.1 hypothetical protein MFFC18_51350 [Mariniblastus fucicola]